MQFLDARRLTGPSLLFDGPAAILDIDCSLAEADRIEPIWKSAVQEMIHDFGYPAPAFSRKDLTGGVSLAFTAPVDGLYAASEINEWAFAVCLSELTDAETPDFEEARFTIAQSAAEEQNPLLHDIMQAAKSHRVTCLWDDDEVSLGLGRTSITWPARELPNIEAIDWSGFEDVPIGLVTGTNGKTTTVRLATHILRGDGRNVGLSSTDWIAVNDRIIDRGDWSGPGGARAILRQADVDIAILESARGGLLRRGLGVERADAALITNIAEDHLGDFGSKTIDELLDIKWIVSRAVQRDGDLILNADDARLAKHAGTFSGRLVWFSLDAENPLICEHVESGGVAFLLRNSELICADGADETIICRADAIPIALGGAARHNVANSLAAAALCRCLGADTAAIAAGLTSMSQEDNPGRCNVYDVRGRKVLVDFAHNPHAMQALFDMAQALPARRRVLCFGQAGDRPDDLVREMTRDAWEIGLDRVIVSELEQYHRGREHGDIYRVIRDELLRLGADSAHIEHFEEESESLAAALDWADAGDLVIMLALGGSAPIQAQIHALAE